MGKLRDLLAGGEDKRGKLNEALRRSLAGLDLQYGTFRRKLYAYGKYQGLFLNFKHITYPQNNWTPPSPYLAKAAINCRLKIPGTAGNCFQMSVSPRTRPVEQKSFFSRKDPEPGFTLGPFSKLTEGQARAIFARLSRGTKDKLFAITDRYGVVCAITTDWEPGLIGRQNALKLVGGDEDALACLDLQALCPFGLMQEELIEFLNLMQEAVKALAAELAG